MIEAANSGIIAQPRPSIRPFNRHYIRGNCRTSRVRRCCGRTLMEEALMEKRHILKSAVGVAGTALTAGTSRSEDSQTRPSRVPEPGRLGSYVETRDGQQLFYKDWGTGAPVVFLAAGALPSEMWDYQMVPMSEQGLRCIAYDRRGHGRSSQPGTGYDYDTLADDLAAVLDALDLRGVTLVGMSMAGGEMVRYLTRHGQRRIARVVFVATAATPIRL